MSEAEAREEIERRHRMDDHAVRSGKQIGLGWRQAHEDRAVLLDALQARDARLAEMEEYARQGWVAAHAARDAVLRCDALAERLRRVEGASDG